MAVSEKNILNRLYIVAVLLFIFAIIITAKLFDIQFVEGKKYRELAKNNTTKNFIIPANRGNIYADDGSLLATSVPKYDIRFDAVTVSSQNFKKLLPKLAASLSKMFGKPASYYKEKFRKARANKNRYMLVARNLGYTDYIKIKKFPLFNLGAYKGGLITEQTTVREHPLGKIAERLVGNEKSGSPGEYIVGLEGAYDSLLKGKNGRRLKQKIAKGQWKPVFDENQIEPEDGYDVVTTIDVNIQDIAHHALLKQLQYYEAEHGTVIVMEVATGAIKAIANLGRTQKGTYYEKLNYGVGESHEPGSTFKVMAFMAALEDKIIDTSTVVDTKQGVKTFYGRKIYDSHHGGYGKISAARALEVSSNIGLATIIDNGYAKDPKKFIQKIKNWNLNKPLGIPISGEGKPVIPEPGHKLWSKNALPSMAYGYNLRLTPLQTLTFYNAIANNGKMLKPRFIKEIRKRNKVVETFSSQVLNPKICSDQTLSEIQEILKNIVVRGTGKRVHSPFFTMAGKTGTAQTEYWMPDWNENKRYVSSFAGYFPAEHPKYSCIVVIHKPSTNKGYYGADVSGPVFKRIAQKIYTDTPLIAMVEKRDSLDNGIQNDFQKYYQIINKKISKVPEVIGMTAMDAIAMLENLGCKVVIKGVGANKVVNQSINPGTPIIKGQQIVLTVS
jgi:cell division protein FtsI (penicillin-binding protein 3)